MKRIKVTLTEDQLEMIIFNLSGTRYEAESGRIKMTKPQKAFLQRTINILAQAKS